ncbi:MAG: hypothetical protein PHD11_06285 [Bacteroidales bacterium]|nr:hypothetical protein [Bacteroidales bacterium]MDD4669577.1 hypothetical protein [Bacteroidales bacterium]
MRKIVLLLLVLILAISCESINYSSKKGDRKVARIGRDVLYESEITKLMPQGVSSEDSVKMVRQYIDTWALSKLLLLKAEEQLSKSEKDVTSEVEEFRSTLLGFRFEKLYLEERLDTVVTNEDAEKYFEDHSRNYIFPNSIIKGRIIRISPASPYYEMIKSGYKVTEDQEVKDLKELCFSSADKYIDFNNQWVDAYIVAKEIGETIESCEKLLAGGNSFEITSEDCNYLIFITERIAPNEISPFEYNVDRIRETVISKRKQELLAKLERDLLTDAVNNKILNIYNQNEKVNP